MLTSAHQLFLRTFGNPRRVELLLDLLKGPKTVTQLTERSGMEQSAVSHNLQRLLRCGFVTVNPNGKERIYSVNKKTIGPLIKFMNLHIETYCKHLCEGC